MPFTAVDIILAVAISILGLLVAANDFCRWLMDSPKGGMDLPIPPISFLLGVAGTAIFLQLSMPLVAIVYGVVGFYGIIRHRFVCQEQGYM